MTGLSAPRINAGFAAYAQTAAGLAEEARVAVGSYYQPKPGNIAWATRKGGYAVDYGRHAATLPASDDARMTARLATQFARAGVRLLDELATGAGTNDHTLMPRTKAAFAGARDAFRSAVSA